MASITTEIVVDATPQMVWDVLMEFDAYPEWNPFVVRIEGGADPGDALEVRLEPPDGPGMTIKPKVTACEPGTAFRWLGHLFVPGLFDGEHIFEISAEEAGGTRFVQREEFGGVLSGLMLRMIGEKTEAGFHAMNEALKARAESRSAMNGADGAAGEALA